jgi:hypothetical protein
MPRWSVYTRPGCTLCESFILELAELLGPTEASKVMVFDITDDPDLERRYRTKIPVLTADDDFVCCYRLDRERVSAYLNS